MPKVVWYFRKKRELGNFSIENSFRELLPHFDDTEWEIEWKEASWFSEGLWNRIRIAREARRIDADIIHITGDINFAALLLKGRKVILTIHDNGFFVGNQQISIQKEISFLYEVLETMKLS